MIFAFFVAKGIEPEREEAWVLRTAQDDGIKGGETGEWGIVLVLLIVLVISAF